MAMDGLRSLKMIASSEATSASHDTCYDPLETFIDYDQLRSLSPSRSPSTARVQTASASANPNNTLLPASTASLMASGPPPAQSFAGPSHQYDLHKQQTGIPLGALANTLAVNQATGLNLGRAQSGLAMSMTDETFFASDPMEDLMTFGSQSAHHPSFSAASDVDMDFETANPESLPPFFFPEDSAASSAEFVDPATLVGQEDYTRPADTIDAPVPQAHATGRLWPGMHQQQAALAKAQQQQKQHQRSSQPQAKPAAHTEKAPARQHADPLVEERISRLLRSMRQASVTGSSEGGSTPHPERSGHHSGRMRKDEEEMDEDERLLASEEGKRLTSKERRQLRNKVSARAFRSRRKEYIGQLEAELSVKSNEANDLKQENRALMEENTRLSDLTRMLLSSPAFSTFLDTLGAADLPTTNAAEASTTTTKPSQTAAALPAATPKDPNPLQALPPDNSQEVRIALLPDAAVDYSNIDVNPPWGYSNMTGLWGNPQPQVFSVIEVPEGPAVDSIDAGVLSGKPSSVVGFGYESKTELPLLRPMPDLTERHTEPPPTAAAESTDLEESDPAFALFADAPVSMGSVAITSLGAAQNKQSSVPFNGVVSAKMTTGSGPVHTCSQDHLEPDSDAARIERFQRLCGSVEAAFQRISRVTAHLQS